MSHFRISDDISDHPHFVGLTDRAFRSWVYCGAWCQRHLTDGRIPTRVALMLPHVTAKALAELSDAGLLLADGDEFVMAGYLKHNDSRAKVQERRQKIADRQKKWRERQDSNGVSNGVTNGGANPSPHLTSPHLTCSKEQEGGGGRPLPPPKLVTRMNPRIVNNGAVVECWDFTFRDLKSMAAPIWPDEGERYTRLLAWMGEVDDQLRSAGTVPRETGKEFWPRRFREQFGRDVPVAAADDTKANERVMAILAEREAKRAGVGR